ncbi:hypothetical protein ACHHYP_11114 [Achlya hypogyna]|uniref:Uncharacterized protein n=1 Tax=Achlya hypogyna TaxID=1202772 RepID=A0A1V9YJU8_ACHHY|nr:hypothetical protein ACHHYP_11114 [Achlya hypogyna]
MSGNGVRVVDSKWSGGYTEAEMQALAFRRRMKEEAANPAALREAKKKKKKRKKERRAKVDEFGRDIPAHRARSRSNSSVSSSSSFESLPPEDPFRPDPEPESWVSRAGGVYIPKT